MSLPDYFLTCKESVVFEQKITGSRFLGYLFPVSSASQAENQLNLLRKKFYDATHHCYAWRIRNEQTGTIDSRFNDDGEPSGTAGKPILQILEGCHLENVLVVIVRYFGGTKLGTGGLVKAYGSTAKETVEKSEKIQHFLYLHGIATISYEFVSSFLNLCHRFQVVAGNPVYSEQIDYPVAVLPSKAEAFVFALTELSNGKVTILLTSSIEPQNPTGDIHV